MFKPPCNFLFYIDKLTDCTNDRKKARKHVINILTYIQDVKKWKILHSGTRMQFGMIFMSGVISKKNTCVYIIKDIISLFHFYEIASVCHVSLVLQKRLIKQKPGRMRSHIFRLSTSIFVTTEKGVIAHANNNFHLRLSDINLRRELFFSSFFVFSLEETSPH